MESPPIPDEMDVDLDPTETSDTLETMDTMETIDTPEDSSPFEGLSDLAGRLNLRDLDFEELAASGGRWVREHPLVSVGVAAGVGFVLGALVCDRSSRPDDTGSVIRQAAADVGRELESQALGIRRAAAEKLATAASSVVDPDSKARTAAAHAAESVTDTLRTAVAALAMNKLGEWLRRAV